MEPWGPVLATLGVNLLAVAFFYGTLWRASRDHDKEFDAVGKKFEAVQREQNDQWSKINTTAGAVERIKGKLGMNGSAS